MASYVYNPYALPLFVCTFIVLFLGVAVVVRDRGSRVGVVHLFETIAIGGWFGGFGMAYLAADREVADGWFRLAHVYISFIPPVTLLFACSVVGSTPELKRLLGAGWIGGCAFAIAGLFFPSYFGSPYHYFWGYYPQYTLYSGLFIPFIVTYFALALALFRPRYRALYPSSISGRRTRLFFVAFACGSLGMVDFLPAFDVPIYAAGYVPVVVAIGLATYITSQYRLMDITPEFAAKEIVETVSDGLLLLDSEGVMQVANEALLTMIGLPKEEVIGRRIPRALRTLLTRNEIASIQAGVPMHNREIEYVRRDGRPLNLSFTVSVIRNHGKKADAYVCAVRDITEQKRVDQRIRFLAYYDNLTGLPNRQQFQEQLRTALAKAAVTKRKVALLFLDLDHFKRINDTLGHALGDSLLQAIAGRVIGCVRKMRAGATTLEDTVARLGGDEFIVGLYDLESQDDAMHVAERILSSISDPVRLDQQHEITVTASLGISIYPRDGSDAEALLKNADAAMYQAKEAGRNSYFFYDRAANAEAFNRLSLETKLRKALEQGHLTLHYQPQVATHGTKSVAVEALLRWHDPELGWIMPERFIPIAEETGLILRIGDWVLQEACAQARAWHDAGLPLSRMAVNLSGRQFRDRDLVATVRSALTSSGLKPSLLELELTESMVMQDAIHTRRTLEALKAMRVHLSIDDFGTGYSSLNYLRSFPIDTLKIDRSFVHNIATENDNGAIVAAIIAMARSLKIGVIGEGVETEEQRAFLQMHGCKLVQGNFFCEPLPADELAAWLQTRTAKPSEVSL